jgi:hypothetical protein
MAIDNEPLDMNIIYNEFLNNSVSDALVSVSIEMIYLCLSKKEEEDVVRVTNSLFENDSTHELQLNKVKIVKAIAQLFKYSKSDKLNKRRSKFNKIDNNVDENVNSSLKSDLTLYALQLFKENQNDAVGIINALCVNDIALNTKCDALAAILGIDQVNERKDMAVFVGRILTENMSGIKVSDIVNIILKTPRNNRGLFVGCTIDLIMDYYKDENITNSDNSLSGLNAVIEAPKKYRDNKDVASLKSICASTLWRSLLSSDS